MAIRSPGEALDYLRREKLGDCTRCALSKERTRIVFGAGNPDAEMLILSHVPGVADDKEGEPFATRQGQILTWCLEQVGMNLKQVYLAHIVKCRPLGRVPDPKDVATCLPFLHTQIWLVQPKVILVLGRATETMLLGHNRPIEHMRRGEGIYQNPSTKMKVPVVTTRHPTYVLQKVGTPIERATRKALVDDFRIALQHCQKNPV